MGCGASKPLGAEMLPHPSEWDVSDTRSWVYSLGEYPPGSSCRSHAVS